jgi:integration host factor subunit beta
VAIGRIENGAYEASDSADDLIGHGWISATLHVTRVVSGASMPAALPVRYFAHTYMRDDRNFMFVLAPVDARLEIATAQLMSERPRAVRDCP